MTKKDEALDEVTHELMVKALVVVAVLSIILLSYLLWVGSQEKYSIVYIYPQSYSNYAKPGESVSFKYGIYCREGGESSYVVKIYVGNELLKTERINLKDGETWEKNETVQIPSDVSLPVKLRVVVEVDGREYEAYFWLKEEKAQ